MDQRDQAVSELNQLVGITTYEQGDKLNISLASGGQALLSGQTIYPLQAVPSSKDISRTVVAYTLPAGAGGKTVTVELGDTEVTGGKLGGLLQFRANSLDVTQSQLGQMAVGLALSFNAQHKLGLDQNGNPGGDYFSIGQPKACRMRRTRATPRFRAPSARWATSMPRTTTLPSTAPTTW